MTPAHVNRWTGMATAAARVADLLLPPRCPACGAMVDVHGTICADCWSPMTFIEDPVCQGCGAPFDIDFGEDALCASCLADLPDFAPLRAAAVYDDASRPLVLRFKHGDATHCAPTLARWMLRAGGQLLDNADWLVPVPLHRWRLFGRRYNQSALLAGELAKISGVPSAPLALRRIRRTVSQGTLSRTARARNVAGAFAVAGPWKTRLSSTKVILVDDVATTGATLNACAKVLKKAGVAEIGALTVARALQS